jgi:hypothetical protein
MTSPRSPRDDIDTLGRSWDMFTSLLQASSLSSPRSSYQAREDWSCVASFEADRIPIALYVSNRTGLRVCTAMVEGPIVNGFFALATEAVATDYAHPHDGTLQVLCIYYRQG